MKRFLVPWMHVKIAQKVIKAWNFVQMKLLSCRSKMEFGHLKILTICFYANMAASNTDIPPKGKKLMKNRSNT